MPQSITLTIPLVPPSVNHYKMRTLRGVTFVGREAKAFKEAVGYLSRGKCAYSEFTAAQLRKVRYELEATVYFAKGQKGDGDNLWKVLGDSLKEAGVIHSDAAVSDWIMRVRRDPEHPRTEITVRLK